MPTKIPNHDLKQIYEPLRFCGHMHRTGRQPVISRTGTTNKRTLIRAVDSWCRF